MVEDIEMLNFDYEDKKAKKMSDWRFENVQELRAKRKLYENRYFLHLDYWRNEFTVPELHYTAEEDEEIFEAMKMVRICTHYTIKFVHSRICKLTRLAGKTGKSGKSQEIEKWSEKTRKSQGMKSLQYFSNHAIFNANELREMFLYFIQILCCTF